MIVHCDSCIFCFRTTVLLSVTFDAHLPDTLWNTHRIHITEIYMLYIDYIPSLHITKQILKYSAVDAYLFLAIPQIRTKYWMHLEKDKDDVAKICYRK